MMKSLYLKEVGHELENNFYVISIWSVENSLYNFKIMNTALWSFYKLVLGGGKKRIHLKITFIQFILL